MSIEAMTWVLNDAPIPSPTPAGMPSATALSMVLLGLANHADRDGEDAFPSVSTLARYSRISERQVQRCLSAALELGLIELGDQRIVEAKIERADQRPTCYNLVIHRGDKVSPRKKGSQVKRGDNMSPRAPRGDMRTPNGVTRETERGDTHVTRTVLEPKDQPAMHVTPDEADDFDTPLGDCKTAAAADKAIVNHNINALRSALQAQGLTASFHKLDRDGRAEISELVALCGIALLVQSARRMHRPDSPARYVQAWLPTWRELRDARPAESTGPCERCVNGWIENDEHDIVGRCECRGAA